MNSFNFTGNLGGDSEVRYTQNNKAVCVFSVPVTQGFGEYKKTSWIRCNLWGKRAESLNQYLKKGQQVAITGELFVSEWEKDGVKNKMVEVNVIDVTLVGQAPSHEKEQHEYRPTTSSIGEDIPF